MKSFVFLWPIKSFCGIQSIILILVPIFSGTTPEYRQTTRCGKLDNTFAIILLFVWCISDIIEPMENIISPYFRVVKSPILGTFSLTA